MSEGKAVCPHCKMEIPAGGSVCPYCRKDLKPDAAVIGCLTLIVLCGLAYWYWPSSRTEKPAEQPQSWLRVVNYTAACLPSRDDYDEFTKWAARGDNSEAARVILRGRGTLIEKGRIVKLLDPGVLASRVRFEGVECYIAPSAITEQPAK